MRSQLSPDRGARRLAAQASRWRPSIVAVSVGLAVSVSACGSQHVGGMTTDRAAADVVHAAYAKTIAARSAHVSFTTRTVAQSAGASRDDASSGGGVIDFATGSADITEHQAFGGDVETRRIGNTVYHRISAPTGTVMPGDTSWTKLTLPPALVSAGGAASVPVGPGDPGQALATVEHLDQVTRVGAETVRGISVTHYRGTVQFGPSRADVSRLPSCVQQFVRQQRSRIRPPHVDVWLDSHGRLVRMQVQSELPGWFGSSPLGGGSAKPSAAARNTITTVEDFTEFGVPVRVSAPPASEVHVPPRLPVPHGARTFAPRPPTCPPSGRPSASPH